MTILRRRKRARRGTPEDTASALSAADAITVIVEDTPLSHELVRLACLVAKAARYGVRFLHVIEVPRTLPIRATLSAESERADLLPL
jgi:hypothetical protein